MKTSLLTKKKLNLSLRTYKIRTSCAIFVRDINRKNMKNFYPFILFFTTILSFGQSKSELLPNGTFPPVEENIKPMTNEKFVDGARLWIGEFSRGEYDITEVTENSLTIDAFRDNAFLYTNRGESFPHKVKYQLKITKNGNKYSANFKVTEIYTKKTILESTLADYFTSDGKLKEGFEEVKPSMDRTVNIILGSFYRSTASYRN